MEENEKKKFNEIYEMVKKKGLPVSDSEYRHAALNTNTGIVYVTNEAGCLSCADIIEPIIEKAENGDTSFTLKQGRLMNRVEALEEKVIDLSRKTVCLLDIGSSGYNKEGEELWRILSVIKNDSKAKNVQNILKEIERNGLKEELPESKLRSILGTTGSLGFRYVDLEQPVRSVMEELGSRYYDACTMLPALLTMLKDRCQLHRLTYVEMISKDGLTYVQRMSKDALKHAKKTEV